MRVWFVECFFADIARVIEATGGIIERATALQLVARTQAVDEGVLLFGNALWRRAPTIWRRCRAELPHAAFVVVAKMSSVDVVEALDAGADDFWTESPPAPEAAARLSAHARRSSRPAIRHTAVQCAGPKLPVQLVAAATATELHLLEALATSDVPIDAEELARTALGRSDARGRGRDLVYRHIANIRKKLNQLGFTKVLVQQTASGYRLCLGDAPLNSDRIQLSRIATSDSLRVRA